MAKRKVDNDFENLGSVPVDEKKSFGKRKQKNDDFDSLDPILAKKKKASIKRRQKFKFLRYLKPSNLKSQVSEYEGDFNNSEFLKYVIGIYTIVFVLIYLFQLHYKPAFIVVVSVSLFIPSLFILRFKRTYERRRFEEVASYMDQMLYSFRKKNKILLALEDTLSLFKDNPNSIIYRSVKDTIDYIKTGYEENIYEEAFKIMEGNYKCSRLEKLHKFLIMVEKSGGDCEASINILIKDKTNWVDRMNDMIKERDRMKNVSVVTILISFGICLVCGKWVPKEFSVVDMAFSQAVSCGVILANFLIWYLVDLKLSESIISKEGGYNDSALKESFKTIRTWDKAARNRKTIVRCCIMIPWSAAIIYVAGLKGVIFIVLAYAFILTMNKRTYNRALKVTRRHIEKVFPDWLMSISLRLQGANLFVALVGSLEDVDKYMKKDVKKLIGEVEAEPNQLDPYINFLNYLHMPEITSSLRFLYSLGAFGAKGAVENIDTLNERNIKLTNNAEKLKLQDDMAVVNMMMYLPVISSSMKVISDMILMIFNLTSTGFGL